MFALDCSMSRLEFEYTSLDFGKIILDNDEGVTREEIANRLEKGYYTRV